MVMKGRMQYVLPEAIVLTQANNNSIFIFSCLLCNFRIILLMYELKSPIFAFLNVISRFISRFKYFSTLRCSDNLSGETTLFTLVWHSFCKGVNLKGKNLLPVGANSFL